MKVVATICSREKNHDSEPLPAVERYTAEHVRFAQTEANRLDVPLYILSGKYGLISGDDFILDYDYLLEKESNEFTNLVRAQAQEAGITEIDFYYKDKEAWDPYIQTLRKACDLADIAFGLHRL